MSRWFRHYAGMMRDDKLVGAAIRSKQPVERVVWVWGAILESASEINDDGRFNLDTAEVAYFLRADEADIRAVLAALADAGRVDANRVVKWGDRQFQNDRTGGKSRGDGNYVYFVGTSWDAPAVKVGISKNPWARVSEFQTGTPDKLSVLAAFRAEANSEIDAHDLLKAYRKSGEWFAIPDNLRRAVKNAALSKEKPTYEQLVVLLRSELRSATSETETETELDTETENKKEARPTPRQRLELVLDADHAGAVIEHRQRIRKPMTERAAQMLATELAKFPDPNAAADRMIAKGWSSIEAEWPSARASPPPKQKTTDARNVIHSLKAEIEEANAIANPEAYGHRPPPLRVSHG